MEMTFLFFCWSAEVQSFFLANPPKGMFIPYISIINHNKKRDKKC